MTLNSGMFSSDTDRHNTPQWLVERVADFFGGIELDPCTDASNPTNALEYYTAANNGLSPVWRAANVYMNPPYGREIGLWTNKLAHEYESGFVDEAIALLPARTDTQWWQGISAYPVCFVRGRLKFNDCAQSAPFPSALVYLGDRWQDFARDFGDIGIVYVPDAYMARICASYEVAA